MPLDDLRVDEDLLLVLLLRVGGQVQDEEPERQRNLVGGQADPPGVVHQIEHRPDRRAQAVVDLRDRTRRISQGGMRVFDDLKHEGRSLKPSGLDSTGSFGTFDEGSLAVSGIMPVRWGTMSTSSIPEAGPSWIATQRQRKRQRSVSSATSDKRLS